MRPACNVLSILKGMGYSKSKIVSNFAIKSLLCKSVVLFPSEFYVLKIIGCQN